ncbi:ABC transporter permease [Hymenobacter negativus]|uniref:ABC transporter permease n=1 Tax=Hymenobacter negativus TaxID=2795026 RepID=A0ABS3QH39_9BACT|nr:ABC transporter permease [Hymenobacter negativus]MBO2010560.1 ABC transporter permease [Hymenobacter negativus]
MVRSALWHLFRTGLAVWVLASVVFLLSYRSLNATTELVLPDTTDLATTTTAVARRAAQQAIRQRLGLDLPLFYIGRNDGNGWHWNGQHNQYHRWAGRLLHGDLGTSFRTGQAVSSQLGTALAYTLPLTGTAAVLAVLGALGLAQRLATRPWWHRAGRGILLGLHALPLFVVALALLLLLANPEMLAWFPTYGLDDAADEQLDATTQFVRYIWHLVLPVAALTLSALPDFTLQLEAALTQELRAGYAITARAKGLSEQGIIRNHVLRNALLPTLTQVAQLLPALVAGAVVVEVVFALPGMGRLLAEAAANRDFPILVGGVLLTGLARLLALLLADLLYLWADPRIRWQS